MKWIPNRKKQSKAVRIFLGIFTYDCKCVNVWVCVGYSCVLLSVYVWVHIVYVYVKVQTQHVVFTGYKVVGVSYFCYIIYSPQHMQK